MRDALMRDLFLRVAALPPEEQPRALEEDPLFQRMPPTAQERIRQRLTEFNAQPPGRRAEFLEQARRGRAEHVGQGIFLRVAPLPLEAQQEALKSDDAFAALPPRAQERFRRHLEHFNSLPADARPALITDEQFLAPLETHERQLFQRLWRLRGALPPGKQDGPRR